MSDSAYKQIKIERLYAELELTLHRVAQLEDDYKKAVADCKTLAKELMVWRKQCSDVPVFSDDGSLTELGIAMRTNDKSGALDRVMT
jgi:hypothetical protein